MTIHLPKDLEISIRGEVNSGHFASEDEFVETAVRAFLSQRPEHVPASASEMGSIGTMHDDAELLEQITQNIMRSRATRTLRRRPDE